MIEKNWLSLRNSESAEIARLPRLAFGDFRREVAAAVSDGCGISALFGFQAGGPGLSLLAALRDYAKGCLRVTSTDAAGSFESLTPQCPEAHLFEREIAERWGVTPEGHPWLKPVRFPSGRSAQGAHGAPPACGVIPFYAVEGEEVHEVAVGPVHAGVIEPGHFRFQCHGETVLHLEISLGYQHRGAEKLIEGGPEPRRIHAAETLCGDTSIGHASAFCQVQEALAGSTVSARAQAIRGIALELERIANHVGDLGALAGDVGFLPTSSFCGRIRGDILNLTAAICGSRFGRGLVRPGGAAFDLDEAMAASLGERLESALRDTKGACDLLWKTPSVVARFENTGTLTTGTAARIGMVGPAARACGIERDVRTDFPAGIHRFAQIPVSTWRTGDVFARAFVRWMEIQRSAAFVLEQLRSLPPGAVGPVPVRPAASRIAVSLVEGWRGEICHAALTRADGGIAAYKVVDPSFHNWFGLALALRGEQISDFPLCNKSFNLSYCGHDL